jgi:hypothetical protein
MHQPNRHICRMFHIDTNKVNARSCLVNMNRLEKWHEDDVITLAMSEVAQSEAAAGGDRNRKSKAHDYVFTGTHSRTQSEKTLLREIERVLFPSGVKSENEGNDVAIVFNAIKYGAILITNDGGSKRQPGGILGNRHKLKSLGAKILTDEEAVQLVQDLVKKRDERMRLYCERAKIPLPDWVGNDSGG